MSQSVVSNASPLIALHQIGQLDILPHLFDLIQIPSAVAQEITSVQPLPSWIQIHHLNQPIGARILQASLGAGESGAIALALELAAPRILLDDRPARRLAQALGFPIIGTVGLLLAAKQRGLLPELRPALNALKAHHFYIADHLYEMSLRDAGELSD